MALVDPPLWNTNKLYKEQAGPTVSLNRLQVAKLME